jgi:hypothetical protein
MSVFNYAVTLAIIGFHIWIFFYDNASMVQTIFLSVENSMVSSKGFAAHKSVMINPVTMNNSAGIIFAPECVAAIQRMKTTIVVTVIGMHTPVKCVDICNEQILPRTASSDFIAPGGVNVPGRFTFCEALPDLSGCRVIFEFDQSTSVQRWLLPTSVHFSISFPWIRAASILYNISNTFSDGNIVQYVGSVLFAPYDFVIHSYAYTRVYSTLQFTRMENIINDTATFGYIPILISQVTGICILQ